MYCKKCGNKLNKGDEFCSSCGSKILIVTSDKEMKAIEIQPKDIQRTQEMKRKNPGVLTGLLIGVGGILILCLILTVTGIISIGRNAEKQQFSIEESDSEDMPEDEDSYYALKTEGTGYESGEEALGAYLHFLQNQDVDGMISCFSVETYCEKVDIKKYAERRGVYQPYSDSVMPVFGDFSKDIFVKKRIAEISRGIHCQYTALVAPGYVNGEKAGIPINLADYDRNVDEMFEQLYEYTDDEQFKKDFSFEDRFADPYLLTNYVYGDENNAKYRERNRNIFGAQDYESVIAEFEFDGKTYLMCADAIEYDEKWYLHSLGGNAGALLNIDTYHCGIVEKQYAGIIRGAAPAAEAAAPAAKEEAAPAAAEAAPYELED